VDRGRTAEEIARHADALALEAILAQRLRVVGGAFSLKAAVGGGRVGRIGAADGAQQDGGVGHGARHRAGGVLGVGDRDDAAAADQAQGRLDAD
nr:hypothetical protein [Tanacetum cinerariifolium]